MSNKNLIKDLKERIEIQVEDYLTALNMDNLDIKLYEQGFTKGYISSINYINIILKQNNYINIQGATCYLKNPMDGVLVNDLTEAKTVQAKKIIFYGAEWTAISKIKIDEYHDEYEHLYVYKIEKNQN